MRHRILVAALAVLVAAILAPSASAHSPHRYSPKHGAKCHRTYRRVKHHGHVFCVKRHRKATAMAPEKVKLHAHLDPTFTRNPLDPFEVKYAYSASATMAAASAQVATVSVTEEPAPLPSGVLSLFSDGQLECAINVGSGVEGSECPVSYKALGEHRVTTIYTSGEQSATETEVENIGPLGTETTLSVSYAPLPYVFREQIGTLTVAAGLATPPGGSPSVELCGATCSALSHEVPVYGHFFGQTLEWVTVDGEELSLAEVEKGIAHARAHFAGTPGFSPSTAEAAVQFTPAATFPTLQVSYAELAEPEALGMDGFRHKWRVGTLTVTSEPSMEIMLQEGIPGTIADATPAEVPLYVGCSGGGGSEVGLAQTSPGLPSMKWVSPESEPWGFHLRFRGYSESPAAEAESSLVVEPAWLPTPAECS